MSRDVHCLAATGMPADVFIAVAVVNIHPYSCMLPECHSKSHARHVSTAALTCLMMLDRWRLARLCALCSHPCNFIGGDVLCISFRVLEACWGAWIAAGTGNGQTLTAWKGGGSVGVELVPHIQCQLMVFSANQPSIWLH